MSATLEREQLFSTIWQLVGKLSLSEKLKLSEQLTSDVRIQLVSLHLDEGITQKQVRLNNHIYSPNQSHSEQMQPLHLTIDESDAWSEEDLVELREASLQYAVENVWSLEHDHN